MDPFVRERDVLIGLDATLGLPHAPAFGSTLGRTLAGMSARSVAEGSYAYWIEMLGPPYSELRGLGSEGREMVRALQMGRLLCQGRKERNAIFASGLDETPHSRISHVLAGTRILRVSSSQPEPELGGPVRLSLRDIWAGEIAQDCGLLAVLAKLEKASEIPLDVKRGGRPLKGLWFPHSLSELQTILSVPGAEFLLVENESSGRIFGMAIYHTHGKIVAPEDEEMIRRVRCAIKQDPAVARMFEIDDSQWSPRLEKSKFDFSKLGVANLVVVDDDINLPVELGGVTVKGNLIYRCMHAHMVTEFRAQQHEGREEVCEGAQKPAIAHVVASVLRRNTAQESHKKMGWELLPIEPIRKHDALLGEEVVLDTYLLRTYTSLQDALIRDAIQIEGELKGRHGYKFVDQEPDGTDSRLR